MEYIHIYNRDVFDNGRVDAGKLYLHGKVYRIIGFEPATGDFIAEEIAGEKAPVKNVYD